MNKTYYIGLDVHKETIAIAYALEGSRKDATYHGTCGGTNLAAERALRKLAEKLEVKLQDLKICYEAGPTGFVLARHLLRFLNLHHRLCLRRTFGNCHRRHASGWTGNRHGIPGSVLLQ